MALITVSGFPSAGKSTFVSRLKASFEARLQDPQYAGPSLDVKAIEDDLGHLGRESYAGDFAPPHSSSTGENRH